MKRLLLAFVVIFGLFSSSVSADEAWESDVWHAYTTVVGTYDPSSGNIYGVGVEYPYWDAEYPYDRFKWNAKTLADSVYYSNLILLYVVEPKSSEQPVEIQNANFSFYATRYGSTVHLPIAGSYVDDTGHTVTVYYDDSFSPITSYEIVTKFSKDGITYEFIHNLQARGEIQ